MEIQQFHTIMTIWNIFFFIILISCMIYAIASVRKNIGKFILPYVLEAATIAVNLFFMYIIDHGYVDYGDDKFSGLSALGDWIGFGLLILITLIPLITTIICNILYVARKRKSNKNSFERSH